MEFVLFFFVLFQKNLYSVKMFEKHAFTIKCPIEISGPKKKKKEMAEKDSVKINKQNPHLNWSFEGLPGELAGITHR